MGDHVIFLLTFLPTGLLSRHATGVLPRFPSPTSEKFPVVLTLVGVTEKLGPAIHDSFGTLSSFFLLL